VSTGLDLGGHGHTGREVTDLFSSDRRADEDIKVARKCLLPLRSGDAEHLAQARQIEPRIGRAYGLGRKILCRDRVNCAGLHRLSPRL